MMKVALFLSLSYWLLTTDFCLLHFPRLALGAKIAHHRRRSKRKGQAKLLYFDGRTAAGAALMDDLRKFALYFRPYKKSLVVGVLCILASTVFGLLIPIYVGRAVDELRAGPTWETITRLSLFIVGASVFSGIFLFLQRRILI